MNALENWFCSSSLWRSITQKQILPWMLADAELGDALEIGAGPGAATDELRRRSRRVVSLEYDRHSTLKLAGRQGPTAAVVQGDAARLPFVDSAFSSVIAVLVLHHLRSTEQQDRCFAEIHRVLRYGGFFFAVEIQDGWLNRAVHFRSTFVPLEPPSIKARLVDAGFSEVILECQRGAFRVRGLKPASNDA